MGVVQMIPSRATHDKVKKRRKKVKTHLAKISAHEK